MELDQIKATTRRVQQGAWVKDLPDLPGIAVKVRSYRNADFKRNLAEVRAEYKPEELLTKEVQDKIQARLLLDTILLDWSGIDEAPYSREMAETLLNDPEFESFRQAVDYAAGIVAIHGQEQLEADIKN